MNQTYSEFIQNILQTRGRFACGQEYHERHHIVPKCLGGDNNEENLIDLYAKEHFIAHKLLALEHPENDKLISAYNMMAFAKCPNHQRFELSPEEYAETRKIFSDSIKTKWQEKHYRDRQIANLKRRWENPDYRKKQSDRRRMLNYQMWSDPEFKKRMGKKVAERLAKRSNKDLIQSQETMRKVSNNLWQNPEYIKQHCSPVHCLETGEYFFKQQDAVKKYGINSTGISNYLKGRQHSAGKHPITGEPLHWESVTWETYFKNKSDDVSLIEIDLLGSNES